MHRSVLLAEVLDLLRIKPDGRYVDGTLGMAGHAEAILRSLGSAGRLLGLDVDPESLKAAQGRLQPFEDRTVTRRVNFRGLQEVLRELRWDEVDGMLFDLGISSVQLGDPARGLSFQEEGPLDMRLDPTLAETAASLLARIDEEQLAAALREFGEARHAKRISRYLIHDIKSGRIQSTRDLAGFCERVVGRRGKAHPATRVFLALRALVNEELEALRDLLRTAPALLAPGGRLAVISFHSLEDRAVKTAFKERAQTPDGERRYRIVTRKPIVPGPSEQRENPRARSAKLRVLERER